jgi:hypothetical protein
MSAREIIGSSGQTSDPRVIGFVSDLMAETSVWFISFVVIDIADRKLRRKALIPSAWIGPVNFYSKKISFNLTSQEIESSPSFDPTMPISQSLKYDILDHYGLGTSRYQD